MILLIRPLFVDIFSILDKRMKALNTPDVSSLSSLFFQAPSNYSTDTQLAVNEARYLGFHSAFQPLLTVIMFVCGS